MLPRKGRQMPVSRAIADKVRVTFKDNTSTIIHVLDDESIQDRIVELCEQEGWDMLEVDGYRIVGEVHTDDFGIESDQ